MVVGTSGEYDLLNEILEQTPIMIEAHPLLPLCLPKEVFITTDALDALELLDDREKMLDTPMVIIDKHPFLSDRLPQLQVRSHPPIDLINANMRYHLPYARSNLITNHKIAKFIEHDVSQNGYDIVILLLVDGLSYGDVLHWKENVQPCLIDGVSVTYQFAANDSDQLLSSVGFASIVGRPPIYQRLHQLNYRKAQGFTYWQSKNNEVSGHIFDGIPNTPVENFRSVISHMDAKKLTSSTYIQIMREGLDGLAHGKRELHKVEIEAAVKAIDDDIDQLLQLMGQTKLNSVLYVTADHGVMWKSEHDMRRLKVQGSNSRYMRSPPPDSILEHTVRFEHNQIPYYLYVYPYIGAAIPKNHSGVHGGLSYHESIVPFAKFEVTPTWS